MIDHNGQSRLASFASTAQSQHVVPRVAEADSRPGLNYPGLLASLGFALLACVVSPAWTQNISLGTAATFGVLGSSTVTNTSATVVTGDVGVWAGTSITGFPPGTIFAGSGSLHAGDPVAQQAQADLTTAYNAAVARPCLPANNLTGMVLGSGGTVLTLPPGVYCFNTSAQLTGDLVLNGAGVYIFQIGT